jgi:anti-sigma factor (TIGR02949 family)
MNCQDALNRLYEIIDKEASDIDAAQVQEHLNACGHCLKVYRLETAVHDLLSEKLKTLSPTPRLESLQSKLLQKLDQIDEESRQIPARNAAKPFGNVGVTLAIAASLLVVVGAAFLGSTLYNHHEVFVPIERSHWRVAENTEIPNNRSVTPAQAVELSRTLHYPLNESIGGFTLINGHTEDLMGVRMGHFVYGQGNRVVSVFVASNGFAIPDDLKDNAVFVDGREFFYHNCRGCRLVYHREGDLVVISATTDRDIDLVPFLPPHGAV